MRKRYEATRPLEAIQIDHAVVDVIVVDESGREIGRPWIALGFCTLTRVVTGFHLTMAPPTRLSTSLCLLHSVCDKTRWLQERGIRFDWPVAGLPDVVIADADSFFGPRAFVRACKSVGIKTIWNAPRDAKYGAHIESMIGTRLGNVPLLTDVALTERSARDGCGRSQAARLSLAELECWIGAEITGNYHRRRHGALRRTPIAAWRALAAGEDIRSPGDCLSFRLSFLPEEECDLHEDGVRLLGQTFWSRALADDFDAERKRLTVRYDPRDLSRIFVKRPSGRFAKAFNAIPTEPRDPDGNLIGNPTPDWSVARARPADDGRAECREVESLALAMADDELAWSAPPANREDAELSIAAPDIAVEQENAGGCDRRCVSSCPFQSVER